MKFPFLVGASAISLAAFSAGEAAAQSANNPIEHCRETAETDKERIACLEAAIMGLMSKPAAVAETTEKPEAEPAAEAGEADAARLAAEESGAEDDAAEEARLAAAEAQAEPEPTGLGAEQVERRQRQAEKTEARGENDDGEELIVEAAVAEFAKTSIGDALFILDNGQIWRKKKSERVRGRLLNSRDYTVKISEGLFSGYRMHINELGETVTVERVK